VNGYQFVLAVARVAPALFAPTPCASVTVCDHPTPCASVTVCDGVLVDIETRFQIVLCVCVCVDSRYVYREEINTK